LKEQFINRMLDLAEKRGIKLAGWEDIARNLTPETQDRLRKSLYFLLGTRIPAGRPKRFPTPTSSGFMTSLSPESGRFGKRRDINAPSAMTNSTKKVLRPFIWISALWF